MRKTLLVFTILLCTFISFSQTVDITGNPSTSGTSVFATNLYAANESIYTEAEIGASNFIAAASAINKIGFNVAQVSTNSSFAMIKIYLMEVPAGTTTMTTGTYSTAGYTQVFGGAAGGIVILSTIGFTEIPLATGFVRTAGNNLQVLIERTDNTSHAGFFYNTANGNNTNSGLLSCRRYNNATSLSGSTVLTASSFRAQIRLKHETANDAALLPIYTLGKLPIANAVPHLITTTVLNNGVNTLTALPVTLNISGANTFNNVQTIASLAPGARTTVNFAAFTPTTTGTNNILVSVPADDDNSNNNRSFVQIVNSDTWSYSEGNTSTGTAGVNGSTIDLVSKYYNSAAASLSEATVYFSAGGQPFKIGVWDATGMGGTPGSLLFETTLQNSVAGVNTIPISPAVSIGTGNFYIGVRQTTTTNFNLMRQTEAPLRPNTFYFASPAGAAWVDNSTTGTNRFMIDAKLKILIDASLTNITLPNSGGIICSNNTEKISVQLTNTGTNNIAVNAASITLKITGANSQTLSQTNATSIANGGSETISFGGINAINTGINYYTVYVNLPGDTVPLNDTLSSTQSIKVINVALETSVGVYPLMAICDDMGWTYYNDADNKSVLAVEWGTNTASKAAAMASLKLDAALFAATSGSGATAKGTFTMKRYWNIDVANVQPVTPVKVRFFYGASEKNAADSAAFSYAQANPGSIIKQSTWFKTNSGAFNGDAAHVQPNGVVNAIVLTDVNTTGAGINGVLYAQFNGITSFSGGTYASGIDSNAVRPVSVDFFKGKNEANVNILNWKITCVGVASVKITVERSIDGQTFGLLNEQTASDVRCLQEFFYTDKSPIIGKNYYRLKIVLPDGRLLYSGIVTLLNEVIGFEILSAGPNPVRGSAKINVATAKGGNFDLSITDLAGKTILKKNVFVQDGNSTIDVDFSSFSAGNYVLILINTTGDRRTKRIIKY